MADGRKESGSGRLPAVAAVAGVWVLACAAGLAAAGPPPADAAPADAPPADAPPALKFATAAESRAAFDGDVRPRLERHCRECHNSKTAEGDLDISALPIDLSGPDAARWALLVQKLRSGEMPPAGRPRPDAADVGAVAGWVGAELKRTGKHFSRRAAAVNGNEVPHSVLFDPRNIPPFDGAPRVRRLSPEIYAGLAADLAKGKPGLGRPFTPAGKTVFADTGAPLIDEPSASQLIRNALLIAEHQTAHTVEGGAVKAVGFTAKEFLAVLDPAAGPDDARLGAAIALQFRTILRREPTAEEMSRFVAFGRRNIADAGRTVGLRHTLAAVLLLPEAVFRMEVGSGTPDAKGRVRLSPREIAYALAYALTDKRPDARLLAAAAAGGLDTDAGVAAEARRMLDDPALDKPRLLRFFREYFGYADAAEVFKDDKANPAHDARVLVEDADRLVLHVLEQDRAVLAELLTTNKAFVAYKTAADTKRKRAQELAKFEERRKAEPEKYRNKTPPRVGRSVYEAYGLTDFPDAQPVELDPERRAGLLTHPAWLVAHSTSFDNHAIRRGKWIRERLLGGVVPDVPITVDAQLPDAPDKTLRERMGVTQQAYCWKCHRLMNDLGLPFERFDHFGRYRTAERVLDPAATAAAAHDRKGKPTAPVMRDAPLDTRGLVAHVGDPSVEGEVADPVALMRRLAASERVEQVFVRHAFRNWLGRNETPGDAASLQAAHRAYRDSGGSMKALVAALLSCESFLYRVPAPAGASK